MAGKFFLYKYQIDDVVTMKKPHPCGSKEWIVLGLGSDLKMKCKKCGHIMEIRRETLEKATIKVVTNEN